MLNAGLSPEHEESSAALSTALACTVPKSLYAAKRLPSEEEQVAQYQGMLQMFNENR
jgi:phosphotransferase system enzyme I (PtsP)